VEAVRAAREAIEPPHLPRRRPGERRRHEPTARITTAVP
jgi:hypothetical protein